MIFYYNKIAGARVTRRGLEDERSNSDRIKVTYLYIIILYIRLYTNVYMYLYKI